MVAFEAHRFQLCDRRGGLFIPEIAIGSYPIVEPTETRVTVQALHGQLVPRGRWFSTTKLDARLSPAVCICANALILQRIHDYFIFSECHLVDDLSKCDEFQATQHKRLDIAVELDAAPSDLDAATMLDQGRRVTLPDRR